MNNEVTYRECAQMGVPSKHRMGSRGCSAAVLTTSTAT